VTVLNPTSADGRWTVDDLYDLPDDGVRYELFDGNLLMSPPPAIPHHRTTVRLFKLLDRHTPDHLLTWPAGAGFSFRNDTTYYVPDIVVLRAEAGQSHKALLEPADLLLAVEVLSPSNRGRDLLLKRHEYAVAGIPDYWIVDPGPQTLTVFQLEPPAEDYQEMVTVRAGEPWVAERPFELRLDPADFC
jgi:Uma2 family endonuclease